MDKKEIEKRIRLWPETIQEKVLSFVRKEDLNTAFFGKMLWLHVMDLRGEKYSLKNMNAGKKDRPFVKDRPGDFNLSHSGDYVLLGLSSGRIGVDIEKHRSIRPELFKRQFTSREHAIIRNAQNPQKQFFDFWSVKESAIKADGRGVEVLSQTEIISENTVRVKNEDWYYQLFSLSENYSMAVCGKEQMDIKPSDILKLDSENLL